MEKHLVILMSGGLDSSIAYHYAQKECGICKDDIMCIWFDIGQPYAQKEKKSLDELGIPYTTMKLDLIRDEFDNIPTTEFPGQIIPGRNLIFATIAASFGKEIWLMALDSETHKYAKERDKSERFFEDTTELLTYIFDISRKETDITSPFFAMTKVEVVEWALKNGLSEDWLKKTSTCYDGEVRNCGKCSTCFKRWVAMTVNGINEEYETNPWESEDAKELINKYKKAREDCDYSHYSKKRVDQSLLALDIRGIEY